MSDKIREAFDAWRSSGSWTRPDDPGEWAAWQAALAQQPAPVAVPDELDEERAGSSWECSYRTGWNECRAAMLAAAPWPPRPPEKLLDQPAKVGAVYFQTGVPERLVIEAAKRHHSYMQAPPFSDEQISGLAQAIKPSEQPDAVTIPRERLETATELLKLCGETGATYQYLRALLAGGDKP